MHRTRTQICAIIGIVLSTYALYVEHKTHTIEKQKAQGLDNIEEFQALCDIESIGASCSSVFALPEGRLLSYFHIVPQNSLLDVPNALLGVAYYMLVLLGSCSRSDKTQFPRWLWMLASGMAMGSSVFLAYTLTVLQELCIVCWSTHLINSILFYTFWISRDDADDNAKIKTR